MIMQHKTKQNMALLQNKWGLSVESNVFNLYTQRQMLMELFEASKRDLVRHPVSKTSKTPNPANKWGGGRKRIIIARVHPSLHCFCLMKIYVVLLCFSKSNTSL